MKPVTFCLTSCNRFDLLQRTLDSIFASCNYPMHRFLITEDSTVESMRTKINHRYSNRVELIFNETNKGHIQSIEKMYNMVDTEYIFHSEDDWEFKGNPNFIEDSINILEERKDLHQIWLRTDTPKQWLEKEMFKTETKTEYFLVKRHHISEWSGFSFNPGLRRKSDFLSMFPNGFGSFKDPKGAVFTEYNCNLHANTLNYRAASLKNTTAIHIGHGRTSC